MFRITVFAVLVLALVFPLGGCSGSSPTEPPSPTPPTDPDPDPPGATRTELVRVVSVKPAPGATKAEAPTLLASEFVSISVLYSCTESDCSGGGWNIIPLCERPIQEGAGLEPMDGSGSLPRPGVERAVDLSARRATPGACSAIFLRFVGPGEDPLGSVPGHRELVVDGWWKFK